MVISSIVAGSSEAFHSAWKSPRGRFTTVPAPASISAEPSTQKPSRPASTIATWSSWRWRWVGVTSQGGTI